MENQFTVPQFIDTEDKIIGPITARQFIILLVTCLLIAIVKALVPFTAFVIIGLLIFSAGLIVAFLRINGQPFHFFILNLIQTLRKPMLRVWDKTLTDSEIKELMKTVEVLPPSRPVRKATAGTTRLQELTLVVNTGGAFKPEDE